MNKKHYQREVAFWKRSERGWRKLAIFVLCFLIANMSAFAISIFTGNTAGGFFPALYSLFTAIFVWLLGSVCYDWGRASTRRREAKWELQRAEERERMTEDRERTMEKARRMHDIEPPKKDQQSSESP